jgi:DNA-binding NarL/FixJ family response regulator
VTTGDRRRAPQPYNVLAVDDYEPWRRYVCAEIRKHARWCVIGEAANGVEAVRLARALKPDLILLEVDLPLVNGIDAARQILEHAPDARILFVSQHHSPDIAEAALKAGGCGYLFKLDAARDLLFAMEAVVNRGRFITAGLQERIAQAGSHTPYHEAGFYSDETSLLDAYTRFAETALAAGSTLLFAGTESRRAALQQRLRGAGFNVGPLVSGGRVVLLDEERVLSSILVNGAVTDASLRRVAVPLILRAQAASHGRVAACGGLSGRLLMYGKPVEAIRLERLWDGLVKEHQLDMLCGYAIDVPRLAGSSYVDFQSICGHHSLVHVH